MINGANIAPILADRATKPMPLFLNNGYKGNNDMFMHYGLRQKCLDIMEQALLTQYTNPR